MDGLLQDDLFGIITIGFQELLNEALHEAVIADDIEAMERLLQEPGSSVNAQWFGDNLLVTAILHDRSVAAKWLVEKGIDCDFETCHAVLREAVATDSVPLDGDEKKKGRVSTKASQERREQQRQPRPAQQADLYSTSCRQLAYDKQMWTVVTAIDAKKGQSLKPAWKYPDMRSYSKRMPRSTAIQPPPEETKDGRLHKPRSNRLKKKSSNKPADDIQREENTHRTTSPGVDTESMPSSDSHSTLEDGIESRLRGNLDDDVDNGKELRVTGADVLQRYLSAESQRMASPTIFWRRSTVTKSAKCRQRLEERVGLSVAAAIEKNAVTKKELNRLLLSQPLLRPAGHDKVFTHPSIRRAHSSRQSKQAAIT